VAAPSDGVVVEIAEDEYSARVRLDDGSVVRVPTPSTYPAVGDEVVVLTAPGTPRAELLTDTADPTIALANASGLLLGAFVFLQSELARRRAGRLLVTTAGPVLRMAAEVRPRWVELHPMGRAELTMSRFPIRNEPSPGGAVPVTAGTHGIEPGGVDEVGDRDLPAGPELYGYPTTADPYPVVEDERPGGHPQGGRGRDGARHLAAPASTPVDVYGLLAQGDYPLVRTADGRWLLASRPARDGRRIGNEGPTDSLV
jgi:hypothetical protein